MIRLQGWRSNFNDLIDAIRADPFVWGTNDCLFGLVVPTIRVIYGVELFEKYDGKYKTAKAGLTVMRKAGFATLADGIASEMQEIHPSECVVGDIAAMSRPDDAYQFALGVVNGDRIFVMTPDGLGTVDLLDATRAFKVGA